MTINRIKVPEGKRTPRVSDENIAKHYITKIQSSVDRGIVFSLSLQSFINIARAKKCFYTGLPITWNTLSIDRIDASKGYEKGNVVACHKHFNSLKGKVEDPTNNLDYKTAVKGWKKLGRTLGKLEGRV